jgi:hypothetical protein
MQDDKVKFLTELLGVNQDLHQDFYRTTSILFQQGLTFNLNLIVDNYTPENIICSWLSMYKNYVQVVSNSRNPKTLEDYPGKMLLWEDDVIYGELYKEGIISWCGLVKLKDFDQLVRERILHPPDPRNFQRDTYTFRVQLKEVGFDRKFNEAISFNADHKMNYELRLLKEKMEYAHRDAVMHLHSREQDFYGLLTRLVHRFKLWGYDFSQVDYYKIEFSELIRTQIHLTPLHFRHTYGIQLLNQLILEPYDNETILKEVAEKLNKEETKLNEMYQYLRQLKTTTT